MEKREKDLNFVGLDPGAARYGNFINYYSFHDPKHRTKHLDTQMFPENTSNEDIICLDIGCNTGDLTKEVYKYLKNIYPNSNIHMLAIDMDPTLILRAQETNNEQNLTFSVGDILEESGVQIITQYLNSRNRQKFDIIFCFSVTMWIHLNFGDEGLMKLLHFMKDTSQTIIVESQPWKCYGQAKRRMKKSESSFPLYGELKIRNDVDSVIEQTLIEKTHKTVYVSPNSPWDRKIKSFHMI